jgi:hypothetical protein
LIVIIIIMVLVVMMMHAHFVLSSLQLQYVNIRRQQQAQTAVQKGHQAVLIDPDRGGAGAFIWDALHGHVERIYVHTELNNKNAGSCEPNMIEIEFDTSVHKNYKHQIW